MRKLQICATICAKLLSDSRLQFTNSPRPSPTLPLFALSLHSLSLHSQYLLHKRSTKINVQMGRIRVAEGGRERGGYRGVWSHLLKSICASQKVLPSGAFKTNLNDNYINVNVPCAHTPHCLAHLTLICICALSRFFFFNLFFLHFGTQLSYELLLLSVQCFCCCHFDQVSEHISRTTLCCSCFCCKVF